MTSPPASSSPTALSPQQFEETLFGKFDEYVGALPSDAREVVVKSLLRFLVDFRRRHFNNGAFLEAAAVMENQLTGIQFTPPAPKRQVRYDIPD